MWTFVTEAINPVVLGSFLTGVLGALGVLLLPCLKLVRTERVRADKAMADQVRLFTESLERIENRFLEVAREQGDKLLEQGNKMLFLIDGIVKERNDDLRAQVKVIAENAQAVARAEQAITRVERFLIQHNGAA